MSKASPARVSANDRYNKKVYESVALRVRRGTRERWRSSASARGLSLAPRSTASAVILSIASAFAWQLAIFTSGVAAATLTNPYLLFIVVCFNGTQWHSGFALNGKRNQRLLNGIE